VVTAQSISISFYQGLFAYNGWSVVLTSFSCYYYFIVILLQFVAVGITSATNIEIADVRVSKASGCSQLPRPTSVVVLGGPVMGGSERGEVGQ